ncbi:hypothetical protein [Sorangium sp. So ce1182]
MASPQSIAGWIDISPTALRKLRAELERHDKSVLDEMLASSGRAAVR